ncbi:hypothetical protein Salat_1185800 [Sesamum alatum]|uniref:Uncharacterized protein n=1 Tax=Sesamum alatum TaxID=300844 RepID=A0AAE1YEU6_9LAMI|nr:hypothetical protein Salat_1185800 [Sesamum alatum]
MASSLGRTIGKLWFSGGNYMSGYNPSTSPFIQIEKGKGKSSVAISGGRSTFVCDDNLHLRGNSISQALFKECTQSSDLAHHPPNPAIQKKDLNPVNPALDIGHKLHPLTKPPENQNSLYGKPMARMETSIDLNYNPLPKQNSVPTHDLKSATNKDTPTKPNPRQLHKVKFEPTAKDLNTDKPKTHCTPKPKPTMGIPNNQYSSPPHYTIPETKHNLVASKKSTYSELLTEISNTMANKAQPEEIAPLNIPLIPTHDLIKALSSNQLLSRLSKKRKNNMLQ